MSFFGGDICIIKAKKTELISNEEKIVNRLRSEKKKILTRDSTQNFRKGPFAFW